MTITSDRTIIAARDRHESAGFYRDLLGLSEAPSRGLFTDVALDGGVLLQFAEPPVESGDAALRAFRVDDELFDRASARPGPSAGPTRSAPAPARPAPDTAGPGSRARPGLAVRRCPAVTGSARRIGVVRDQR